jgi:hypothetical protein
MTTPHLSRTRALRKLFLLLTLILCLSSLSTHPSRGQSTPQPSIYLPLIMTEIQPAGPDEWDPRLVQRGAGFILVDPAPEQGYWRLVTARWLDAVESQGRHHIFVEILDKEGKRQTGVPIAITWNDGAFTLVSEAKPGEPWAANFPMFALAPSYAAQPQGSPADIVTGMGLGSLEEPNLGHHTSYGLTWQWVEGEEEVP